MYLKTPKRYSANRRKRYLFSYGRLVFWLLAGVFIVGGWWVYRHRETLAPVVSSRAEQAYYQGNAMVSTMTAPTPLPTENPSNVVNRADANWAGGRVEDALADYAVAVELLPNDVVTHYRYTLALIIDGRYGEALTAAENTITADPYSSDAWAVKALAQVRNDDPNGAVASGQHALQLNENNAAAYAFLAEAYLDLNQLERARQAVETALEINPDSPQVYYARAQIKWLVDYDLDGASDDFRTAYQMAPYYIDAAVDAASLQAIEGDPEGAVELLNEVKDANPDNVNVLYSLGRIYDRDYGDPNQAADALARCVEVDENSAACHFWYGRVLIRLEQYAQAANVLDRAVQLIMQSDTPDPRYHYWAGEAQIYLGNCPAALNYLRPGYDLAVAQDETDTADALQGSIRQCSFGAGGADTTAPTPTVPAPAENVEDTGAAPQNAPTISPNA